MPNAIFSIKQRMLLPHKGRKKTYADRQNYFPHGLRKRSILWYRGTWGNFAFMQQDFIPAKHTFLSIAQSNRLPFAHFRAWKHKNAQIKHVQWHTCPHSRLQQCLGYSFSPMLGQHTHVIQVRTVRHKAGEGGRKERFRLHQRHACLHGARRQVIKP